MTTQARRRSDTAAGTLIGRAANAAAWSGLSSLALRLGSLTVGIALAWLLTPAQFGTYAVALTVQAILMAVADLGLSADLIRSDDPERRAPTVATLGLVCGTALAIGAALTAPQTAELLGSPEAAPAIAVLSVTLALAGAGVVPFAWLQRRFEQRKIFLISAVDFVVSTTLTFLLIWAGLGVLALAIGRVAAQAVTLVLQFVLSRTRPRYGLDRALVRPVLAFGLPVAAANLLSWALLNVDTVVIARMLGTTALGFYVLAFNISNWPMSALSQIVRSVSLPYFSRAADDHESLPRLTAIIWAAALPAGALLAALSASVIQVLYGDRWLEAAPVLAALGVFGSLRVVFDLFAGYLYARGRSRPVLWVQLVWLAALAALMAAAAGAFGIVGAGWVHVAVAVGVVLPAYLLALRRSGVPVGRLLLGCWMPVVAAVPAFLVAGAVGRTVPAPPGALLLGAAAGALVYAAVCGPWLLRRVRILRASAAGSSDGTTTELDQPESVNPSSP